MDNYRDEKPIEQIDMAITVLKDKKVLFSILSGIKTYFIEKKSKVLIVNGNSSIFISYDEFKSLYDHTLFYIFEEKEENYDFSRDDEYYSWKHK